MKVSQRVSELHTQTVGSTLGWSHFKKRHNSVKKLKMELWCLISEHRVMMPNICTKLQKISQRVSELLSGCNLYTEICKGA